MTKKLYTKDMEVKEVIERLQKGEVIRYVGDNSIKKLINGILVNFSPNLDGIFINDCIDIKENYWYFEVEENKPFQITKTGLYKTRDGRRAFVSIIFSNVSNEASGIIEGSYKPFTWKCNGRNYEEDIESEDDIVSKWEE